jgi:cell division protein FtsZ
MLNIRIPEEDLELRPRITVVGVGGAGGNGVNNMITSGLQGVEFLVCNSDAQALKMNLADRKIQLGLNSTRGLGAGARPDVGRMAADEALDEIMGYLEGSNMVFITAGMGGGTGTGAAPVIARAAKEAGILTVGVVTKPFHFEGAHRMRLADAGIEELQQHVDTLLIIPNQNLFRVANEKTTFADAFKMADEVLHAGVRGVTDLMVMPGLINLDFADIRAVMSEMGKAMMGTGEGQGDRRAIDAAEAAINNPLLEDASMQGAKGLLINITGGMDMTLYEVDEACNRIRDEVDPDANIIFGSTFNPELDGKIRVSVVATGIDNGMRAYKTPGQGGFSPEVAQPQQPQQHYGLPNKAAAPINPNTFGRGVTLRQGQGVAPATNQSNAVGNTTTPTTRTGTGTPTGASGARATAMANNPGFFSRAAAVSAARRVEEEYVVAPLTVGALEEETAEEYYQDFTTEAHVEPTPYQNAVAQQQQRAPIQQPQRGERSDDGSFIPPMPMMIDAKPVNAPLAQQQQQYQAPQQQRAESFAENDILSAPQREVYQQPSQQTQQQAPISAPASAKAPEASAKRPGLFDRLAGRQPSAPPAAPPAQPVLTVDNSDRIPASPSSFDEDLDIPAFLRRQAN